MGKSILPLTAMFTLVLSAADTVTLNDGKVYEGTFVGANADHITFQVDGHTKYRFAVDEIHSIRFERSKGASPIDQKYSVLKGSEVALGEAIREEQASPDSRGRYRLYQNGAIYYTPQTGAHAMRGPIADRWLATGAERGELGYPTSDEMTWPDGRRGINFEHGTIIWNQHDEPVVEISAH